MDQGLSDKKNQNLHEKVLNHFSHSPLTYQNTHNLYNAGKKRYFFFLGFFLGGHITSIFSFSMSVKLNWLKIYECLLMINFFFFLCVNLLNPDILPTHESVFYEREHGQWRSQTCHFIYRHGKSLKQGSVLTLTPL